LIASSFKKYYSRPEEIQPQPSTRREPAEDDPTQILAVAEPSSSDNPHCEHALAQQIQNLKLHIMHLE